MLNRILIVTALLMALVWAVRQPSKKTPSSNVPTKPPFRIEDEVVEASCGECHFGMPGDGCNLAIPLEGKVYFVDGTEIDNHGDAHAESGFCNHISERFRPPGARPVCRR